MGELTNERFYESFDNTRVDVDVITLKGKNTKLAYILRPMYGGFDGSGLYCYLVDNLKIFPSTKTLLSLQSMEINAVWGRISPNSLGSTDALLKWIENKSGSPYYYHSGLITFRNGLNSKADLVKAYGDHATIYTNTDSYDYIKDNSNYNACTFSYLGTFTTQNLYVMKHPVAKSLRESGYKDHFYTGVNIIYHGRKPLLAEADKVFLTTTTSIDKITREF